MNCKKEKYDSYLNKGLSFAAICLLFAILGAGFTFYYDLNDDVLIKDIVSGAYTGNPSAYTNQLLYPIASFISILYKIVPALPWYGLVLCGCQGICFYLILQRSLTFVVGKIRKIVLIMLEVSCILALCMWELVIVQYTVTSALLAATACFLVFTKTETGVTGAGMKQNDMIQEKCSRKILDFLWENKAAVILVILSFNIRSEMLLLMSPFIALTGIVKWAGEEHVFEKKTVIKYLSLIGTIIFGLLLSLVIDTLAYSGKEWKDFREFFDARTKVYDYTWYPSYENAAAFYHDIGLSNAQVTLIDNYNFGLDEAIDSQILWEIADYAEKTGVKEPLLTRLKAAAIDYKWRTFHEQDAPYNYMVLAAYGLVIVLGVCKKDKSVIWKLPLMWIFRTIPWMYVIISKRVPARISHPLYYIELIVLCAWIILYCDRVWKGRVCAGILGILSLCILPSSITKLSDEMQRREDVNAVIQEFAAYAKAHPENYYYMDVYSTVDFSEKMFMDVDNSQKNYDILGGWLSGSPLQKKSTDSFYEDRLSRAELLLQDNFYFVIEEDADISFLQEFYGTQGIDIVVSPIEEISREERTLVIYEVLLAGM